MQVKSDEKFIFTSNYIREGEKSDKDGYPVQKQKLLVEAFRVISKRTSMSLQK